MGLLGLSESPFHLPPAARPRIVPVFPHPANNCHRLSLILAFHEMISPCGFDFHSLVANDIKHLCLCLMAISMCNLENCHIFCCF